MTKSKAENAVKKLQAAGIDSRMYPGYSGRGMNGAETFGVVVRVDWTRALAEQTCPGLRKCHHDQLGKGIIYY